MKLSTVMLSVPLVTLGLGAVSPAAAQQVRSEVFDLESAAVTVHLHPFLSEDEITTLRLVGQNPDALALFMPEGGGHGALAVAPADGFIRDGLPAESAVALSDLPDRAAARSAALSRCNSERSGGSACVIVLEVAPR